MRSMFSSRSLPSDSVSSLLLLFVLLPLFVLLLFSDVRAADNNVDDEYAVNSESPRLRWRTVVVVGVDVDVVINFGSTIG